jgi:hypothetical protein
MLKQLLTLIAGCILLTIFGYGQQDATQQWGETITGKMAQFLPQPVPGLAGHEPAGSESNEVEKTWGDATQNWKYLHPRAEQAWWFDDPDLAQKWAAAKTADEARPLQGRERSLRIEIHGNESLDATLYRTRKQRQPSGTIKGHTVYRATDKTLGTPDAPAVFLAIYLGPEGFSNPAVEVPSLAAGPKCITVMAWLQPRADTLQADEAMARKMLEAIDYDGLAKLIEP